MASRVCVLGRAVLTRDEIKEGIKSIQATTGLSESARAVFKHADVDHSKEIDVAEFMTFVEDGQNKQHDKAVKAHDKLVLGARSTPPPTLDFRSHNRPLTLSPRRSARIAGHCDGR